MPFTHTLSARGRALRQLTKLNAGLVLCPTPSVLLEPRRDRSSDWVSTGLSNPRTRRCMTIVSLWATPLPSRGLCLRGVTRLGKRTTICWCDMLLSWLAKCTGPPPMVRTIVGTRAEHVLWHPGLMDIVLLLATVPSLVLLLSYPLRLGRCTSEKLANVVCLCGDLSALTAVDAVPLLLVSRAVTLVTTSPLSLLGLAILRKSR